MLFIGTGAFCENIKPWVSSRKMESILWSEFKLKSLEMPVQAHNIILGKHQGRFVVFISRRSFNVNLMSNLNYRERPFSYIKPYILTIRQFWMNMSEYFYTYYPLTWYGNSTSILSFRIATRGMLFYLIIPNLKGLTDKLSYVKWSGSCCERHSPFWGSGGATISSIVSEWGGML